MVNSLKFLVISVAIIIKQTLVVSMEIMRGRVSYYPNSVKLFEKKFSKYIGVQNGIMFSNATSALEAAMFSVGVNSESKVGTTAFVIPSSYCSAHSLGAEIEFIDIDKHSLNLDYKTLIKKEKPSITTLVVTHFYGNPCDMESIMSWAKKHNIFVIEDCSHAHGATFNGKPVGSWGHIGVFSLQSAKAVSAGEGAIAVTNSNTYYAKMAAYGHQESYKKFGIDQHSYNLPSFGYGRKMRIHPLGAVLAGIDFNYLKHKNNLFSSWFKEVEYISLESSYFSVQTVDSKAEIGGYAQGLALILNTKIDADNFVKKLHDSGINNFRRDYMDAIEYYSSGTGIQNSVDAFTLVVFIPFYQFIDFRRWSRLTAILKRGNNARS
jgi:dTDP-4-amino-4,6-dideoxygalactose transaminase